MKTKNRVWVYGALVVVLALVTTMPAAADLIDQSCEFSGGGDFGAYNKTTSYREVGQIFVPSLDNITAVELRLRVYSTPACYDNVNVSIYAADASHFPTGSALVSGSISTSGLTTTYDWYKFDLTQTSLTIGAEYAIVMSVSPVVSSGSLPINYSGSGNPYSEGVMLQNVNGTWSVVGSSYDVAFHTYGVPEPATMTLLGAGFAALCYRKRRR